ncbi:MAG: hypothetical protein OXN16_06025 [Gammaproteobacteria bacterium]|nr:hypothetical protein [Gammaproteobacteria bacterium]
MTEQDVEEARVRHGSLYMGELYRRQLSTRFGIVSFSTDPFHPLLWSHYTRDGSGFAIGYMVLSTPESNLVHIMRCKSSHWEYESEWRLIVELDLTLGTGTRDRHRIPVNLFRIPNAAVDTVLLH